MFPNMNSDQRKTIFGALHFVHRIESHMSRRWTGLRGSKGSTKQRSKNPSPEAMLVRLLLDKPSIWTLDEHQDVYSKYLLSHNKKNGAQGSPILGRWLCIATR